MIPHHKRQAGIYAWTIEPDGRMFYIGQTVVGLSRVERFRFASSHVVGNSFTMNMIEKALREGKEISSFWLEEFPKDVDIETLNEAEIFWIQYFRSIGTELTNIDDGGSNTRWTENARKKHSELCSIIQNRPEVKALQREVQIIAQRIAQGKPEVRAHNSKMQKEAQNRPEVKAKKSAAQKLTMAHKKLLRTLEKAK